MKPPHDNRRGGSGRPPFEHGQGRVGGGPRPFGQGGGPRRDQGPGGGPRRDQGPGGGPRRDQGPGGGPRRDQGPDGGPRRDQGQGGERHDQFRGQGQSERWKGQGERRDQFRGQGQGERREGQAGPSQGPRERDQRGPRPQGQGFQPRQQREGGERNFHRGPRPQHHEGPRNAPEAPRGAMWLYGLHAVAAALANPNRRLRRLLVTEEASATLAQRQPQPWPLAAETVERARLDHLLGRDVVHQGVALLADPLAPPSLQSVLDRTGPIIVLDQVSDPRNVGAILRSAASFGAAAVIAQERNAPEETGALAKAASGALETMPLLRAVNIARTLIALKAANIWCVGLDAGGGALSGPALHGRRVALVLGAEGEGLRRLTRETCDEVAGFAMQGTVGSLNVSAAAAVALYELTRRS
jgi:23S rRNA (guanosine2251-2'-O)-methyltransferase